MEDLLKDIAFSYILTLVLAAYSVIKIIDSFRKVGLPTNWKRVVTAIVGIIVAVIYVYLKYVTVEAVIPSYLAGVIGYDYFLKTALSRIEPLKNKE
jgi:uncharacterized membrane protein HdeD (DUF308 family)